MRLLLIFSCCISFVHCAAQATFNPGARAKQINDRAVSTYIKYGNNHDSVAAAIQQLNLALRIDSTYYIAWTNKLEFECQISRLDSALHTVAHIVRIFPGQPDLLLFKGALELKTGHNDDAVSTLNAAIKMYEAIPDTSDNIAHLNTAMLNKGIALKLLGENEESKNILVSLSMKEPDLAVRRHINAYITATKNDIMNQIIAGTKL